MYENLQKKYSEQIESINNKIKQLNDEGNLVLQEMKINKSIISDNLTSVENELKETEQLFANEVLDDDDFKQKKRELQKRD